MNGLKDDGSLQNIDLGQSVQANAVYGQTFSGFMLNVFEDTTK